MSPNRQRLAACVAVLWVLASSAGAAEPLALPAVPRLALLWDDPGLPARLGAVPAGLEAALATAGFTVTRASGAELADPGRLDHADVAAVVLPYGAYYPAGLAAPLVSFLAQGGLLVTLGAGALSRPLYPSLYGWLPADAAAPGCTPRPLPVAEGWELHEGGPEDRWRLEPDAQGRQGTFHTERLGQFAYLGTALTDLSDADLIVAFAARGDRQTTRLCLELREQDGSRWKTVIPLGPDWTDYRLHAGQFVSYANAKRGRADSSIRPAHLVSLRVGMTSAMAGPGPHRFELRDLCLETAAVPTAAVAETPVCAGPEREVGRWFGSAARLPPRAPAMTCFAAATEPWAAGRLRATSALGDPSAEPLLGPFRGLTVGLPEIPVSLAGSADLAVRLRAERWVERLPLLHAEHRWSAAADAAAVLFLYREGPLAGGRWLCFGLEPPAPVAAPALAAALVAGLRLAAGAVLSDGVQPRFRERGGRILLDVVLQARGPAFGPLLLPLPLRVQVNLAGQTRCDRQVTVSLPTAAATPTEGVLVEGLQVTDNGWQDLDIRIEPAAAAPPVIGPLRFRLDTRAALRSLAEQMVRAAADDGKLHGYAFIDNRGMRALLGAAEILDQPAYQKTARRWGEAMRREQRPDGGYRMGYGIGAKGEECYVADGGEIAVGMARLAAYSETRERQALLRSLDAYSRFREDFRAPAGGVGVGWCLQDYGQRPPLPLTTPTRIYAPERNTYTVGCSLAAAYLHARLLGTSTVERRAEADADWLMSRTATLHGAFMESFAYAHALSTDPTQRAVYGDYIGRAFTATLKAAGAARRSWWLSGGGRSALDLGGMAYVLARIGDDPALRAEMMRATCLMFSPDSPESVLAVSRQADAGQDGWIYVCYGTLGLVDVIQPVVSLDGPSRPAPR